MKNSADLNKKQKIKFILNLEESLKLPQNKKKPCLTLFSNI